MTIHRLYPPKFADIDKVRDFMTPRMLDKFSFAFTPESEMLLQSDYDHVIMTTLDWLQQQPTAQQKKFMQEFACSCLTCPTFEYYVTGMMAGLSELNITLNNHKMKEIDCASRNEAKPRPEGVPHAKKEELKNEDLLYSEKGQDLLKKLREDCPDLPDYVRQGVARMYAAGCIPEEKRNNKPLTGAEKRRLKKFMPIVSKELPKPDTKPRTDYYGNIEVTDKPVEMPMITCV